MENYVNADDFKKELTRLIDRFGERAFDEQFSRVLQVETMKVKLTYSDWVKIVDTMIGKFRANYPPLIDDFKKEFESVSRRKIKKERELLKSDLENDYVKKVLNFMQDRSNLVDEEKFKTAMKKITQYAKHKVRTAGKYWCNDCENSGLVMLVNKNKRYEEYVYKCNCEYSKQYSHLNYPHFRKNILNYMEFKQVRY